MSALQPAVARLGCHPAWPCAAVRLLEVRASPAAPGSLRLTYTLHADLASLRLPAQLPAPRRSDELWRHTCFEAFVAGASGAAYREFNFSPSLAWAAYEFTGYREGMRPLEDAVPLLDVRLAADTLVLDATLATGCPRGRLALAAVLEASDGTLSYWALRHPGPRPDFHHPEGFQLEFS